MTATTGPLYRTSLLIENSRGERRYWEHRCTDTFDAWCRGSVFAARTLPSADPEFAGGRPCQLVGVVIDPEPVNVPRETAPPLSSTTWFASSGDEREDEAM